MGHYIKMVKFTCPTKQLSFSNLHTTLSRAIKSIQTEAEATYFPPGLLALPGVGIREEDG